MAKINNLAIPGGGGGPDPPVPPLLWIHPWKQGILMRIKVLTGLNVLHEGQVNPDQSQTGADSRLLGPKATIKTCL